MFISSPSVNLPSYLINSVFAILWNPTGFPFMQLTAMHLVDAHLCSDPGKYVSALILSLSTMLHLELPHINVLSKIDLIENYGKLGTKHSSQTSNVEYIQLIHFLFLLNMQLFFSNFISQIKCSLGIHHISLIK